MTDKQSTQEQIQKLIDTHPILLFMKGSKEMPQCGFSGQVVHVFTELGVNFHTIDVLEDEDIRQGIKKFSNWPTIPQLYVKGEFIGGCDIITEMYQSGDLQSLFEASECSKTSECSQ